MLIFIILAGNQGGKYGVHHFLSIKPLVKLGGVSYGLYLWHWPIHFILTGRENVPERILLILLSIVLSYFVTIVIEKPIRYKSYASTDWRHYGP